MGLDDSSRARGYVIVSILGVRKRVTSRQHADPTSQHEAVSLRSGGWKLQ